MSLPRPIATLALSLATLLVASGCASVQRRDFEAAKAKAHVYPRPLTEVWSEARKLIEEKGFIVLSDTGTELVTDWRVDGQDRPVNMVCDLSKTNQVICRREPMRRVRYLLLGKTIGPDAMVRIVSQSHVAQNPLMEEPEDYYFHERPIYDREATRLKRDQELEWELARRVQPAWAAAVEKAAATKYQ